MSDTTPITPELNNKVIEEFSIGSSITIGKYLHTMHDEENEVYIYLNTQDQSFVTEILGMDLANGSIWLGRPYDKNMLQAITADCEFVAVSFPENIKLQFCGKGIEQTTYEGTQALRISVPKSIVRLQRRNYFRVMADEDMMAHVHIEEPGLTGEYELVDISLAGCGISVNSEGRHFSVGQGIHKAKLVIPDHGSPLRVSLVVKNIKHNPDDASHVCLGCEMHLLLPKEESRLQRFLLAAERRQREQRNAAE